MSDIPVPNEVRMGEGAKDLVKEFNEAAQIGRMALQIARERADGKYTMPYLDPQRFSTQDVEAIMPKAGDAPLTAEDIAQARKGAIALAVEAAAQIAEAQAPGNPAIREELESLEGVFTLVKRSNGFIVQVEAQNPQDLIQASREAVARRQKVQPEVVKLTDDELKRWTTDNSRRAEQRIGKSVQAVREYLI